MEKEFLLGQTVQNTKVNNKTVKSMEKELKHNLTVLDTKVNKNTVKINLKKLVDYKLITKEGKGKGTWYRYSE